MINAIKIGQYRVVCFSLRKLLNDEKIIGVKIRHQVKNWSILIDEKF